MQQTLLFIPHEWFAGRLLVVWLVLSAILMLWLLWRHGWSNETWSFLPVLAIGAVVIWFVLPHLEIDGVNPTDPLGPLIKVGLAIRGYGIFLLLAIVSGVGITLWRSRAVGIDQDRILSLAFWMTFSGMVGARLLYIVQKSDEFLRIDATWGEKLVGMLDMTKGGLVVYGSLIGGILAALIFFRVTKLPVLRTADLLAPGMVLGLAIGRIGCLMNGCCYGGICESDRLPALQFPAGSPPYMQQMSYGELLGLTSSANEDPTSPDYVRIVTDVAVDSLAAGLGIVVGDRLTIYAPDSMRIQFFQSRADQSDLVRRVVLEVDSQRQGSMRVPLSDIPTRSLRVHPTQVYSSIDGFLLCLLLSFYWTVRKYDGEVFALMLILHSIARYLLEIIRRDESGLFGTELTISQWMSVVVLIVGVVLFGFVRITKPVADSRVPVWPT